VARAVRHRSSLPPIKENLTWFDLPGDQLALDRRRKGGSAVHAVVSAVPRPSSAGPGGGDRSRVRRARAGEDRMAWSSSAVGRGDPARWSRAPRRASRSSFGGYGAPLSTIAGETSSARRHPDALTPTHAAGEPT